MDNFIWKYNSDYLAKHLEDKCKVLMFRHEVAIIFTISYFFY